MPQQQVVLSVVIVNYNVRHFLEQALQSVYRAAASMEVEVFVVDNNSVDDSVAMVKRQFPQVILLENRDNPGFAVANNQAIRQARGRYILLLNPDTVVNEDTFAKCTAFMDEHPEAGGLGVRMIDGAGNFLPESKRGFPSPWVAFCKTFGLSSLFPKSRLFNRYHLGYLDENEVHEVEVLAGAFMWLRKSVLDEIGLLDEAFFMYGEDIDLSYRIVQAGYKNIYFPKTTIIHYKGESTKKGSLNYVRTFYQAMIIFARKHFQHEQASLYIGMLRLAIYLRAGITLITGLVRKLFWPMLDATVMYVGLLFLKNFWASYHFRNPDYFDPSIIYTNFPLYVLIWLSGIYLSGGYDRGRSLWRLVRGLLAGTLVLAAIYGLLELEYRSSRALILLGSAWAMVSTVGVRYLAQVWTTGKLTMHRNEPENLVIVGELQESERVRRLLQDANVQKNFMGTVAPERHSGEAYLSDLSRLDEVVRIYRVQEVIFCSADVQSRDIMHWMTALGPSVGYKIVPRESMSVIGSSNKNTAGQLYTIEIQYNIAQPDQRRNKRLLDLSLALALLLSWPFQALVVRRPLGLLVNALAVLSGRKSWVGYATIMGSAPDLPPVREGILDPVVVLGVDKTDEATVTRLNFFYAKDYHLSRDTDILWKGWNMLGRKATG